MVRKRGRDDCGDLRGLETSIAEIGLLSPIVLNTRCELVAGERRLKAARNLGWTAIPAFVVERFDDALTALKGERDENLHRLPMTASELVTLGKSIESVAREEAAKRQAATQIRDGSRPVVEPVPSPENKGKTRDIVGKALGVSGRTYEQMKKVVDHGTPELVGAMDDGDLPIKVAAQVADLPPEVQREIVFSQDPRETAKEVVEEFSQEGTAEAEVEADSQPEFAATNAQDHEVADAKPDHPHAKLLQAIVNLASRISAEVNDAEPDAKIRRYLLDIGFVFPRAKIVGERHYGWQCVGLRGLYRVVKLAGLPGKTRAKEKLLKAYQDAAQPEGDK
ncbi:MAG: ParB/RepB/Spo0J family partition protein [Planctomycetes bacterium]|nr:ParB/RepB/Spo0J family partition protein [Planctomycetota bacterium]